MYTIFNSLFKNLITFFLWNDIHDKYNFFKFYNILMGRNIIILNFYSEFMNNWKSYLLQIWILLWTMERGLEVKRVENHCLHILRSVYIVFLCVFLPMSDLI